MYSYPNIEYGIFRLINEDFIQLVNDVSNTWHFRKYPLSLKLYLQQIIIITLKDFLH
jgi:hypothetical protein